MCSASNIATKMNGKLSTIHDKAVSWTSTCDPKNPSLDTDSILWVGERPTLVIGIGLVHGMGYSAKTIVTASTCKDAGCMRLAQSCFLQKKSDTISEGVMKDIIKVRLYILAMAQLFLIRKIAQLLS